MNTLTLTVVVLVVYMGAMLFIGWLGRNTSENFEEYITAAKKGSLLVVCGSYLGSHIGNGVVVGGAQNGADYGLAGVWFGLGACLSYIVFAIVIAKKLYRANCLTLSECLDKRYGGHSTGTIYAVVNCGAAISIMAGQIVAGKALFQYLGLNPVLGAVLCGVVVFIYASMSGQWGVMVTDVIQTGVVFTGTILAMIYMLAGDGFNLMHSVLPAESWSLFNMDAETIVMNAIPSMLYGLVSCASFQRNISAKDGRSLRFLGRHYPAAFCVPARANWYVRSRDVPRCRLCQHHLQGHARSFPACIGCGHDRRSDGRGHVHCRLSAHLCHSFYDERYLPPVHQ